MITALTTDRLILREYNDADIDDYFREAKKKYASIFLLTYRIKVYILNYHSVKCGIL